nr:Nramp family divalent metal transporter [Paraburkholderia kururiensis]
MGEALGARSRGPRSVLLFAGPAVVASIAYMDPGNFATNLQAGARYGYALLWVVLAANVIAMLFQALSAKLGIVTNRNLAEISRDHFPPPVVYAMWGVSEAAAMATDLAEFLGQVALSFVLPVPMIALVIFTSRRAVMGSYVNSRFMTIVATLATVVVLALNTVLLLHVFGVPVPGLPAA